MDEESECKIIHSVSKFWVGEARVQNSWGKTLLYLPLLDLTIDPVLEGVIQ
jgi:hypothetical protein